MQSVELRDFNVKGSGSSFKPKYFNDTKPVMRTHRNTSEADVRIWGNYPPVLGSTYRDNPLVSLTVTFPPPDRFLPKVPHTRSG